MFTNRAKALGITVIAVAVVGALSYGQYANTVEIAKLSTPKVVTITKTVVVTPTNVPTATPAATRIFTPAKANNVVTKGVK